MKTRELKFRVWHPVFGMGKPADIWQMTSFSYNDGSGVKVLEKHYEPECIFLQYTGLKDKNGKEIYEGDLVRRTLLGSNGEVVATDIQKVQYIDCYFAPMHYHNPEYLEVIGNIYENPDLL